MKSVRTNNLSLKYERFKSFSCKDIGFRKSECVAETQFLSGRYNLDTTKLVVDR